MSIQALDALWNYGDPAGTEAKFRGLLSEARQAADTASAAWAAELLTQIARAQGLQQKYAEALATLADADAILTPEMLQARVRSLLERGRVCNSSARANDAIPFFEQALGLARAGGLDFFAVDAAHMLGIACKGDKSLQWNEEAIRLAEAATEQRARGWLGALYNNTGWTYHDLGRHEDALTMFQKDLEFRSAQNNPQQIGIARWAIARMKRHLGRVEEALRTQMELLHSPERRGNAAEGYTQEEIGECLLLLGRTAAATPHFARAWELLRHDPWLQQDEAPRLERLQRLGRS